MRELFNMMSEQSVLVSLIAFEDAYDSIAGKLHDDLFHAERHKVIFLAIDTLKRAGKQCDMILVHDWLKDQNKLDDAGGEEYLVNLDRKTAKTRVMLDSHIIRLTELMALRKADFILKVASDHIQHSPDESAANIINNAAAELLKTAMPTNAKEAVNMNDCLKEMMADLESTEVNGYTTGFKDLDRLLGTLEGGDLVVLAARPSMGKTAISLNIMDHIVSTTGKAVFLAELEMKKLAITQRLVSARAGVHGSVLRDKTLRQDDWIRLTNATAAMVDFPLYINDKARQTMAEIRTQANELKRKHGSVGTIVVDHLGLMGDLGADNRNNAIGLVTAGLKELGKELDCPIILLSQLNRKVDDRPNKKPVMSDLRDSGNIEQDADIILFMFRDEYYTKEKSQYPGIAEVIVAKQRKGATGSIFLSWQGQYSRFVDLQNYVHKGDDE